MHRLSHTSVLASVVIAAAALVGCASTEGISIKAVNTATAKENGEMVTGSRISRTSTDRLIKSTVQDKADEPVRSIGNLVGRPGGQT
ncbi:MAG: hypothetical protein H7232_04085 [Aeromicrobium sp.]|nr:hypothetical protein [Burkholderiales bacterium]